MSSEMKVRKFRLHIAVGKAVDIPGEKITEITRLPSGLPMVTWQDGDCLRRMGGFPFEVELEPPSAVEVVGALPPGLPRAS